MKLTKRERDMTVDEQVASALQNAASALRVIAKWKGGIPRKSLQSDARVTERALMRLEEEKGVMS